MKYPNAANGRTESQEKQGVAQFHEHGDVCLRRQPDSNK